MGMQGSFLPQVFLFELRGVVICSGGATTMCRIVDVWDRTSRERRRQQLVGVKSGFPIGRETTLSSA